jgi:hypothetical protein
MQTLSVNVHLFARAWCATGSEVEVGGRKVYDVDFFLCTLAASDVVR